MQTGLGIGQVARASGLTVSALRFYDGAGVLVPDAVQPHNGYRRYGPDQVDQARLVARLRRVGMPLPDIGRVLALRAQPAAATAVLDRHLRRLEDGLVDARRELGAVRRLLDREDPLVTSPTAVPQTAVPQTTVPQTTVPQTAPRTAPAPDAPPPAPLPVVLTVPARRLAAALRAVRPAVGTDGALPVLQGVLLDLPEGGGLLHLVATDRYRLAVSSTAVRGADGPSMQALLPTALVDGVLRLLGDSVDDVTVALDESGVHVTTGTLQLRGESVDVDYPDYRRLLHTEPAQRLVLDADGLRAAVTASTAARQTREQDGVAYDVVLLTVDTGGTLRVTGAASPDRGTAVSREFLLDALDAVGTGQLVLELDGPIAPLVLRDPDPAGTVCLVMPTRLS